MWMCWLAFHYYDKKPEKISIKEKRLTLAMVLDVSVHGHLAPFLWAFGKAEHHDAEHVAQQSCLPHSGQKVERWGKGSGTRYTLPAHASSAFLPPTMPHLLQFPTPPNGVFNYEPINGLIDWWGQSPYDLNTSQKFYLWLLLA